MQRADHGNGRATYRVSRPDWKEIGYQAGLRLALVILGALLLTIAIMEGYL